MGNTDFLTPKAIATGIKAKGLQKLRYYCQLCQKQCRDLNGFKCHCISESHQRQMHIFGQNPDCFVDGYSQEFETQFLDHIKRAHRSSSVAATLVYNEYIADRHHIHMNSTRWLSLTQFVEYLGRTGKCKVEETHKGLFLTYIDRDSNEFFKDREKSKSLRADEEKKERELLRHIKRAADAVPAIHENKHEQGKCSEEMVTGKVAFALGRVAKGGVKKRREGFSVLIEDDDEGDKAKKKARIYSSLGGGERPVLGELMREEERMKEKMNRKDYWLCEGIVVKVMSKALAEKGYYKMKGVVKRVISRYVAEVQMIDSKHKIRIDQVELETVISQIGGLVRIVNGAYRGSNARLLAIDTDKLCAKVQIEKGLYDGRILPAVDYEDICKVAAL